MSTDVYRPLLPWSQFASSNPDLAAFGAARLTAAPAYLATIRADGSPRVHPISPIVAPSGLYVFMEPTSPKAADLRERARFALHSGVPDNAGTGGEFHVSGGGRLVDESAIRAEASAAASYSPAERYILFELRLGAARANGYGDVDLPAEPRWEAAFLIRDAEADDLAAVSDLYRRSSLSNDGDREALLAHPEALVFPDASIAEGRTRVAVGDGRIVGFATTRPVGDVAELDDLFVDPDWMRRGVARALVRDALARLEARGLTRVDVIANPHALAFYGAVGFVADGLTETEFGVATRMHLDVKA